MSKHQFHLYDGVMVGEPPHVEEYVIVTEPNAGRYCMIEDQHGNQHTVYLGRWATPLPRRPHPIECESDPNAQ